MAFATKDGKDFAVRKGRSGAVVLARFPTQNAALDEVDRLHLKHKPTQGGRSGTAQRQFVAQVKDARKPGVMGTPGQESVAGDKGLANQIDDPVRRNKRKARGAAALMARE